MTTKKRNKIIKKTSLGLNNFKMPSIISLEDTKKKIGSIYKKYQKQKEIDKKKAEKNKIKEEKKLFFKILGQF